MGLRNGGKERFKPRCQKDDDTGEYICNPELVTEDGILGGGQNDIFRAKLLENGNIEVKQTGELDEQLIDRTLNHLQSRRV